MNMIDDAQLAAKKAGHRVEEAAHEGAHRAEEARDKTKAEVKDVTNDMEE